MKTPRPVGLTALLVLSAMLLAPALAWAQGGPPPARVRLDSARMESVEQLRRVTGELRAVRRAVVSAEEEGRLVGLSFDAGDLVEQGQTLARQDTRLVSLVADRLVASVGAAEARLRETESAVEQERRNVARLESAIGRGGVAESELEDAGITLIGAEARAATALAELETARALLEYTRAQLDKMTILAPFDGAVVEKSAELGEWIGQGDPIAEIVSLDRIDAWLDVPEAILPALGSGASIDVEIDALAETLASGEIAIIASGDTLAHTFPVRVRLDNPGGRLRPGMAVTALIPSGRAAEVLTVHKDAILRDDAGSYLYFDGGGTAVPARVERLWAFGDRAVIRSPMIRPGTRVVTEGNERLFPGQPLIDTAAGPGAEGAPRDNSPPAGRPGAGG
jgi:membrane fusion protein (multidrug efflux system)